MMDQYRGNPQQPVQSSPNPQQQGFQPNMQRPVPPAWQQPVYQQPPRNPEDMLPPQYKPLGAWAYFGYMLLFSLPIIGFILLIVFSCSDANINRRNFARSYWCVLAVAAICFVIMLIFGAIAGSSIFDSLY